LDIVNVPLENVHSTAYTVIWVETDSKYPFLLSSWQQVQLTGQGSRL